VARPAATAESGAAFVTGTTLPSARRGPGREADAPAGERCVAGR
jgi:hypothetical protein